MGNGALLPLKWPNHEDIDISVITRMMPAYYIQNDMPTAAELSEAYIQWHKVYSEECRSWSSKRRNQSNREMFESVFYERLYDIHPLSRQMQLHETDFLPDLMEVVFQQQRSRDEFISTIRNFIKKPSYVNMKSIEHVIVGDVLLHAIETVLGPEIFNSDVLLLWRKVYSVVLRQLIPQTIIQERLRNNVQTTAYGTTYTDDVSTAHVIPSTCEHSGVTPISSVRRVPALQLDASNRVIFASCTEAQSTAVSNECFKIVESGPSKMIYCREATVDDVMDFSEIP